MSQINLVPIYSRTTRKVTLSLSLISTVVLTANFILQTPFVDSNLLLWFISFLLACVNFSKLGKDEKRDRLSRYITLKLTISYFIGFLLATSFTEIFLNSQLPNLNLFTVLSGNIVFLISHYALYYFAIDERSELNDEGLNIFLRTQKPLLLIAFILSIITFLSILLWI